MQGAPFNVYGLLANSEIPWPTVTLSTGEEALINSQGYSRHRSSRVYEDRKAVFDAFWTTWGKFKGTAGTTLSSHLNAQLFTTRVRNYDDTLTRNLFSDNLPREVYDTLVKVTNENLPSLHRYLELKGRVLGLEDMGYEDIYVSMVESPREFNIEDTIELVNKASVPLGETFSDKLADAASQRWMHVYPTPGKRSGAYMSGFVYDEHPYILLNHQDDYNSVSTYAHEWGHAMHQVLANETQPQHLAGFSIFTTEAAAIAQELLTQTYMLSNATTDQERLYYLGYALEQIRTTFFRQTMFSEFEGEIYAAMERGEPLSGDRITQIYGDILRRYHGADQGVMRIDELYHNEWLFVPHFYFNFYVFQYSTSIAGAAYFTEQILNGGQAERDNYLNFLKAGGSKHPYDLFMDAGLDMASPEPYEALIRRMDQLLDDFEATLNRVEAAQAAEAAAAELAAR
ncbi:MAG: M3 family oligoendopeptidase [Pseudomonadota bacterium]